MGNEFRPVVPHNSIICIFDLVSKEKQCQAKAFRLILEDPILKGDRHGILPVNDRIDHILINMPSLPTKDGNDKATTSINSNMPRKYSSVDGLFEQRVEVLQNGGETCSK